ncbi:MAG: pantoate--beta-alanine ligase [Anaerolineae bacterium]
MIVTADISEVRKVRWESPTATWGLAPTMGALHAGHESLMVKSVQENDKTCATIFVNPTQFAPTDDLDKYPRTLEDDLKMLEKAGVDLVFTPTPEVMYPAGFGTQVIVDGITSILEGEFRPGHFDGVTQIVSKLFNIVQPTRAYFGQKDVQQTVVLKKMIRDLNFNIDLVVCPTVREPDGLAMSSRNRYLSPTQRKNATILHKSLKKAADMIQSGETHAHQVRQTIREMVNATPEAVLIYASVARGIDLSEMEQIEGDVVISLAAWFGSTRLIDNLILDTQSSR